MKTNLVRILALSAIAAAVSSAQQVDPAQANAQRGGGGAPIAGVWDVAVTVVNCQTGALIRNVHSVQIYQPDGAFSETTSIGSRGSCVGYWYRQEGHLSGLRWEQQPALNGLRHADSQTALNPPGRIGGRRRGHWPRVGRRPVLSFAVIPGGGLGPLRLARSLIGDYRSRKPKSLQPPRLG